MPKMPSSETLKQAGRVGSSPTPSQLLPDATLIRWLRDMMLIREFELRTMAAYQQAKIGGFCHIYIGQEATVVGTFAAVNHDDPVVTAYRDHGHALARGMTPEACMAEMYGKLHGCAKGKGGSMHMFDRPNHLYGGHGIVGAQTALGAGLAFAARYDWEVLNKAPGAPVLDGSGHPADRPRTPAGKKVCLCYLGDGALNQGCFHESLNLAGLFGLPVIYVVENNGYSMGTSIERGTTMAHNLVLKAAGYGIEGIEIDGLDLLSLYDKFKPYADRCRENQRPGFVDLKTYRYQGHSMSDPQKYRTKEEVQKYQERDSIDRLAAVLMSPKGEPAVGGHLGRGCLSEEQFKDMQREIKEEVRLAVEFAEQSPSPEAAEELYTDVYANPQPGLSSIRDYHHGVRNSLL
ncbi:MAG: pyruvate dehydrogenase (acetyl-transferring) E1 component subunit alpha [Phycisphaerales bacterium]|nr:pyruvate dehydrogenase (acetyl-transferring) E1 component subunit alpha [Phycisphaerales bacterium]